MQKYLELCERWWQTWLEGKPMVSPAIASRFDLNAAPEPYLQFGSGDRPLIVLTTNPGGTMPHQLRDEVLGGQGVINKSMTYAKASVALAAFYSTHLTGPARQRIGAFQSVAGASDHTHVLQLECIPWHSSKLPDKSDLPDLFQADIALAEYSAALAEVLQAAAVLVISAVSSRADLSSPKLPLSPWLAWQRDLVGLNPDRAEMIPLIRKGEKVTSAALVDRSGASPKALVLMQGGNHLPGEIGREPLARALRPTDGGSSASLYDYNDFLSAKLHLPVLNEEQFWSQFPRDPAAFREQVRGLEVRLEGICDHATIQQVHAQRGGGDDDTKSWDALLPSPPPGYFWMDWRGGVIMPNYRHWVLWNNEFLYPPPRPE